MAEKKITLLGDVPQMLDRPLALIEDRGYLVTWAYARVEEDDKGGKRSIKNEYVPIVLRDNGLLFEDVQSANLGLMFHFTGMPPPDKLMSLKAARAYSNGYRPEPKNVFKRVVEVVDHYIDFSRSLAEQHTMSEMVTCFILSTWFLAALNVTGYLWPNGDMGSGKTKLLHCVAELSYLGIVILAGGTYATLRDMADYGATLCFDDAENVCDQKKFDQDKKSLLLSGNRRGTKISVKEKIADGKWATRYVNAFCPRLFSAINLPDPVLESRSIVVPLIRTPDKEKANRDPVDYDSWPHDRRELLDNLWGLALSKLSQLPVCEMLAKNDARLSGRNLEPWIGILAVAMWLDNEGVSGLWERMEKLSWEYQTQRIDIVTTDLRVLTIKALCECARRAKWAGCAGHTGLVDLIKVTTKKVTDTVIQIAKDEDLSHDEITPEKVGLILRKFGLKKSPRPGGKEPRGWQLTTMDLERLIKAYGLGSLHTPIPGPPGLPGSPGTKKPVPTKRNVVSFDPATFEDDGTLGEVYGADDSDEEDGHFKVIRLIE